MEVTTLGDPPYNYTSTPAPGHMHMVGQVFTALGVFSLTLVTFVGNGVVLLSFIFEKKLRTLFTCYIANLAVTDFLVASTAMMFYSFDMVLGYWPFGQFMCGVWIFFDYGMTFASVFTLVVISMDRYWAAIYSIHYRTHNNKNKVIFFICLSWVAVLVLWLPACISDRVKYHQPNFCFYDPAKNQEFVYVVAVVGHHLPCALMIFCYIRVFFAMKRRQRAIKPAIQRHAESKRENGISTVDATISTAALETNKPSTRQMSLVIEDASLSIAPPGGASVSHEPSSTGTGNGKKETQKKTKSSPATTTVARGRGDTQNEKERKIFVTLTYVIFTYLILWVPFHIVFDITAVNPGLVPNTVYQICFWLTYLNSTLNPIVYAFSSKEFRIAFIKVLKCECFRSKAI